MTQQERSLGKQAIDKVVEIAISSQLDESENLSVTAQTEPLQLAKGEVDSVTIKIDAGGWAISLQDVEYPENKEFSPELTAALAAKASEVLNLRNFELEGMSLRIQQLNVEAGLLTVQAEAKVEQFPS